jgi:hypothetical protein
MRLIQIAVVGAITVLTSSSVHAAEGCSFDLNREKFAGSAIQQARCLLPDFPGPEDRRSEYGKPRQSIGEPLESLVGKKFKLDRKKVLKALEGAGLNEFAKKIGSPLSTDESGKSAQYFVIHDTSTPFKLNPFPKPSHPAMQKLGAQWDDGTWRAHAFVNRVGQTRVTYDFSRRLPHSAVRLERENEELKGLFIHTELTQPRKSEASKPDNDLIIPIPAFLSKQYQSAALLYIAASARGGKWLIPAFHIAVDKGIAGAHDDPQHFDLDKFSAALKAWITRFGGSKK